MSGDTVCIAVLGAGPFLQPCHEPLLDLVLAGGGILPAELLPFHCFACSEELEREAKSSSRLLCFFCVHRHDFTMRAMETRRVIQPNATCSREMRMPHAR